MADKQDQIAALLVKTGGAHHRAFMATNGADAEWAAWYGGQMLDELRDLLGIEIDADGVASLLTELDVQQKEKAPDAAWPVYYAAEMMNRFQGKG